MEKQRRSPLQSRARATRDAILTGAAQVLEKHGESGFNTNRVAERAGVSIGSLYQYFRDKDDILVGLAQRAEQQLLSQRKLSHRAYEAGESPLRLGIRAYINLLPDAPTAREKALEAMLQRRGPLGVAKETDKRFSAFDGFRSLSSVDRFIVSRAITGVVQSAVRERRPDLHSRAFEDALVKLARGFLNAASSSSED
ncbi:MAG: TetR/AcrR family transcriptional regulator [Pseudomonadota bacterium]